MATTAPQPAPAAVAWHQALKCKKHLARQLEKMQGDDATGAGLAQFEAIDGAMEKLRLACVQTIFLDFEYAATQNTDHLLWEPHTLINTEYRRVQRRLRNSPNAVEKRKVEKMYNNFLRIAQKFYKGYVQRLMARYDVPELKRVARGIEVEQMKAEDIISPVPQDLHNKVLTSCHATLLHLGDLARYRVQAKHKKSGYETALTFYSLAHDLVPDSGFAFHQMSVVDLEEGNHLDLVYHLYRAWAVAEPHPHAKTNLESRFKALRSPSSTRHHGPSAPEDVFAMWFVKLHALFYSGEVSSQHKELEGEVMHRLERAAKTSSSTTVLLKMVLINISAYHIATLKFAETQSIESSRFGQFSLTLNIRFVLTLSSIIEAHLREAHAMDADNDGNSANSMQVVECLLPLLRAYCMWLSAHQGDLFSSAESSATMAYTMIQGLARVFTLLCVETYKRENPATCPYLLAEDLELRGFQPLCEDQVPEPCRSYCREDGSLKPHPPPPEQSMGSSRESLARILDILRCAYYMAEDPNIPLVHRVLDNQLVFEFSSEKQNAPPSTNGPLVQEITTDLMREEPVESMHLPQQIDDQVLRGYEVADPQPLQLSEEEEAAESTVFNMLAPFLKPPISEPQLPRSPLQQFNGTQTVGLNDNYASFQPEPSPTGSVTAGKFEPLPWNWVYTPKPHAGQEPNGGTGQDAFLGHGSPDLFSRESSMGRVAEDPFTSPARSPFNTSTPRMGHAGLSPVAVSEEAHRQQLLQSFITPGLPTTSVFSNWSGQAGLRKSSGPAALSSANLGFDNPISSGSTFSHPSSIYHGTPLNGADRRMTVPAEVPDDRSQHFPKRDNAGRRFQMDNTTSQYDAAVFNAAYEGGR